MLINNLLLKNYRNYNDLEIKFNSGLNIFIGDNAQGKTNILESIYVLAVTKSYLGVNDRDLIKFGNSCSIIKANVLLDDFKNDLEVKINTNGKNVFINGKEIKKFKDYVSKLNVIVFSPDNIRMIKDGPNARRKFLNVEISQILNKYVVLMNDFNGLLKQRNELLKNDNINQIYLDIVNDKFVSLAVSICYERKKFLDSINSIIGDIFKDISGLDGLKIEYDCSFELDVDTEITKSNVISKIRDSFERERRYGSSLYGPHRDDFSFFIGDKNISIYGSQGQMRMAILSLKLAEIEVFKKYTNNYPILLLDDIFSELDITKRNNLIKYISFDVQTIITTTDLNMINDKLLGDAYIFKITDGKIIKESEE
jgi:DNA replication and repair protein RecF